MRWSTSARLLTPIFGLLAAACSDLGTESFDPLGTSQKAQQAFAMVSDNPAVQGFNVLQPAFTWTGAPPVSLPTSSQSTPANPTDILPPSALGKTFIYSPSSGKYTSSGNAGAPANGTRFMLYQVEMSPKGVKQPLVEIGQLDLTNENSPQPNSLGIKAVVNGATVIDYRANGSLVGGTFSVGAKGMASGGGGRLDFDLSQSYTPTNGLKIDYKATAPTPDMNIQAVATDPPGSGPITTALTVTEGRNKLEITATGSSSSVTGEVKYNGHDIARISGSGDSPVFTGQRGRQLSTQEVEGLNALFDFVDDLFEGIDDVLIPTYFVLGFT